MLLYRLFCLLMLLLSVASLCISATESLPTDEDAAAVCKEGPNCTCDGKTCTPVAVQPSATAALSSQPSVPGGPGGPGGTGGTLAAQPDTASACIKGGTGASTDGTCNPSPALVGGVGTVPQPQSTTRNSAQGEGGSQDSVSEEDPARTDVENPAGASGKVATSGGVSPQAASSSEPPTTPVEPAAQSLGSRGASTDEGQRESTAYRLLLLLTQKPQGMAVKPMVLILSPLQVMLNLTTMSPQIIKTV
ncbi:uncharacterized protein TM35_000551260 [Trypanosoma theileri]|uniref:Uncharacterized protein n=1 Tax=Trypanosoma theileri TaxID=67003 RepID=A0A1X0NGQ6_9TRYP|nr:uncharacterized protein TM35_000551260 [Trypanosoma theileri]ORC83857.1 hypothetical protein TM35_000551260 [Trypanosoma theileri]